MLVRNFGMRGRNKLSNPWEDDVYVVTDQSERESPLFVVNIMEEKDAREHCIGTCC